MDWSRSESLYGSSNFPFSYSTGRPCDINVYQTGNRSRICVNRHSGKLVSKSLHCFHPPCTSQFLTLNSLEQLNWAHWESPFPRKALNTNHFTSPNNYGRVAVMLLAEAEKMLKTWSIETFCRRAPEPLFPWSLFPLSSLLQALRLVNFPSLDDYLLICPAVSVLPWGDGKCILFHLCMLHSIWHYSWHKGAIRSSVTVRVTVTVMADSWNGIFKCLEHLLHRSRAFMCILSFKTKTDQRTPSLGLSYTILSI